MRTACRLAGHQNSPSPGHRFRFSQRYAIAFCWQRDAASEGLFDLHAMLTFTTFSPPFAATQCVSHYSTDVAMPGFGASLFISRRRSTRWRCFSPPSSHASIHGLAYNAAADYYYSAKPRWPPRLAKKLTAATTGIAPPRMPGNTEQLGRASAVPRTPAAGVSSARHD